MNDFDPTSDNRFCTQLKLVNVPTTTTTHVSPTTVALSPSGTLTDSVSVAGIAAAGKPAGTVNFYVCGPTTTTALCTSTSMPRARRHCPPPATPVSPRPAPPATFTPHQVGTYCFAAVYTPATGSSYAGSTDNQSTTIDPNECATVTAATSTTTTSASAASITLGLGPGGVPATDHVTVTGTPNAGLPTGTVAFYVWRAHHRQRPVHLDGQARGNGERALTKLIFGDVSTGTSGCFYPTRSAPGASPPSSPPPPAPTTAPRTGTRAAPSRTRSASPPAPPPAPRRRRPARVPSPSAPAAT